MTSKLTVYIEDSTRELLSEYRGEETLSQLVNDALESYLPGSLVEGLVSPRGSTTYPSLQEVVKRRPKAKGSSAEIVTAQRKGRSSRLS
jgi:hypothetical protein